jgi:1,4-alpha-glucan branching enzyme
VSENAAVRVQFVLVAPAAKSVAVVGDFNDWNPAATPMEPARGMWSSEAVVSAGRHDYAFVVDGTRWIADPSAPRAPADELGGGYSVLVAGAKP